MAALYYLGLVSSVVSLLLRLKFIGPSEDNRYSDTSNRRARHRVRCETTVIPGWGSLAALKPGSCVNHPRPSWPTWCNSTTLTLVCVRRYLQRALSAVGNRYLFWLREFSSARVRRRVIRSSVLGVCALRFFWSSCYLLGFRFEPKRIIGVHGQPFEADRRRGVMRLVFPFTEINHVWLLLFVLKIWPFWSATDCIYLLSSTVHGCFVWSGSGVLWCVFVASLETCWTQWGQPIFWHL